MGMSSVRRAMAHVRCCFQRASDAMWLKVVAQGDDTLRLEWGDGKGQQGPTYWIGRETLREVSKEVKERLCQLVQWSRGGIESELPRLLRQLASSGERLRHV